MQPKDLLPILATIFLLLFAGIWLYIARELFIFDPTPSEPKLDLSPGLVGIAGVVASAVGAATAGVLGIEIQKEGTRSNDPILTRAARVISKPTWLSLGILLYIGVGLVNLAVWLDNTKEAPELIGSFGAGIVGWLMGSFGAAFKPD